MGLTLGPPGNPSQRVVTLCWSPRVWERTKFIKNHSSSSEDQQRVNEERSLTDPKGKHSNWEFDEKKCLLKIQRDIFMYFLQKKKDFFKTLNIGICEVPFQYFQFMNFWSFRESIWNIACVNLLWGLKIIKNFLVPEGGAIYGYPSSDLTFGDRPRISPKGLF